MPDKVILSVGTKRGLFLLESNRGRARWKITGPHLKGWAIEHAVIDTRSTPRLHVAASSNTYGSAVLSGDIAGRKLKPATTPPVAPDLNPKAKKFSTQYGLDMSKKVWFISPGPTTQKKVLYAGTAPAGLFRSGDSGKTWEPVDGLNKHSTRKDWSPGAGGQCCHSIQVDPHDPQRMYVAISAAGCFRTDDGGRRWKPINSQVAGYMGAPKESTDFT